MSLNTTIGEIRDVNDYLSRTSQERLQIFLDTIIDINHAPDYWFDFPTINKRIDNYGAELHMLDWLHGKTVDEMRQFFIEKPMLLKYVPILLGIREDKMKNGILSVFDVKGDYGLNFANIDISNIDFYVKFIEDSGLYNVLTGNGIYRSVHDYTYGVEAGLNSNARKNRSGNEGESHLAMILNDIVDKNPDSHLISKGQTTYDNIQKWFGINNLPKELKNRRFDGSLYCPDKHKCLFAEVNNFNSSGSKIKAVASEFEQVHTIFSKTNHVFVYITDGKGWESDKSHLAPIIDKVPNVFNYAMVEDGWLDDIAKQIMV